MLKAGLAPFPSTATSFLNRVSSMNDQIVILFYHIMVLWEIPILVESLHSPDCISSRSMHTGFNNDKSEKHDSLRLYVIDNKPPASSLHGSGLPASELHVPISPHGSVTRP
jgi:hypothetical protein